MARSYLEVSDLAKRMRIYFVNSISAINFFTFGMLVSAYFLLLTPFPEAFRSPPLLIAGLIPLVIAAVIIVGKFTPRGYGEPDGGRWALAFSLPFLLYLIPTYLAPQYLVLCTTMWYPSLGLGLLAAHVLIMRKKVEQRCSPFLIASLIVLSTSPAVLYLTLLRGVVAATFAIGLMLLAYYVAGAYSLYAAHKALLEKS